MVIGEEVEDTIQEVEVDIIVEVTDQSGIEDTPEALGEDVHVPEVQSEDQFLPRDHEAGLVDPTDLPVLQDPLHPGLHLHIANLLSHLKNVDHRKSKQRRQKELICKTAH